MQWLGLVYGYGLKVKIGFVFEGRDVVRFFNAVEGQAHDLRLTCVRQCPIGYLLG